MNSLSLQPVATVHYSGTHPNGEAWSEREASITLADTLPAEALDGIEDFSHLQILFYFDQLGPSDVIYAGHPRDNPVFPRVGIFSHRNQRRPNHLGISVVRLIAHEGRTLRVRGLDALEGTPVIDIKPVLQGRFEPLPSFRQPAWADQIMGMKRP